ncbi:MAG: ABC transporter permease [Inquilinus sp.]|uniref:ABC transporter permease n=1 Tax=Inquilinus sp. TaxID=1932117 RepID=UPI003F2E08A6
MTMTTQAGRAGVTTAAAAKSAWRVPSWAITTVSLIMVIGIWQACGPFINPLFASYPSEILHAFWKMTASGQLPKAFVSSMQPFLAGYALAALLGVPAGLLLGRFRVLDAAFGIYVIAGYSTPLIALVPLLMIWFGLGFVVKTVIIFLLTFFPVCINTWIGVKAVPKTLLEVGTAFCAPQSAVMRQIVLPAVLPYIMAGLRLGIGKAVIAMVIAEFLTAISGLGGVIIGAANSFKTAEMFVPIIIIMVLAVLLTALVGFIERRVAPWHSELTGHDGV